MEKYIKLFFTCCLFMVLFAGNVCRAQSPGEYVPCQKMPFMMQNFKADNQAITRFYSPQVGRDQSGGRGIQPADSPEKKKRLEQLYREYLDKLANLNFDGLSQECKADYVLFKRDVNEKLRLSI